MAVFTRIRVGITDHVGIGVGDGQMAVHSLLILAVVVDCVPSVQRTLPSPYSEIFRQRLADRHRREIELVRHLDGRMSILIACLTRRFRILLIHSK